MTRLVGVSERDDFIQVGASRVVGQGEWMVSSEMTT